MVDRVTTGSANTNGDAKSVSQDGPIVEVATRGCFCIRVNVQDTDELQRSLFVFDPDSGFRQVTLAIVRSGKFKALMLLVILFNCVTIGISSSTSARAKAFSQALEGIDLLFVAVFTLEMVLKWVAFGFVLAGKHSYLRDRWNILDMIIVSLGYVNFALGAADSGYSFLRVLRLLSALKTITVLQGMRVMVVSLLASLPPLVNVFGLMVFIIHLFAVVFLHFFQGKLHQQCYDLAGSASPGDAKQCAALFSPFVSNATMAHDQFCSTAVASGRRCDAGQCCGIGPTSLQYGVYSYDNILLAWMNVLITISMEGWTEQMYAIGDTVSKWNYVLYVVLVLVGALFVVHLITAVLFIRFEQTKDAEKRKLVRSRTLFLRPVLKRAEDSQLFAKGPVGAAALAASEAAQAQSAAGAGAGASPTDNAILRYLAQRGTQRVMTEPAANSSCLVLHRVRRSLRHLVNSNAFKLTVGGIVMINTVFLSIKHHGMSDSLKDILDTGNIVFTAIFAFEMVLKLTALGARDWAAEFFNIFDAVVVAASLIEIIVDQHSGALSALQVLRLLRVFKVLEGWDTMQKLLLTILATLVDLMYFTGVLVLFVFVYAMAAKQIFSGKMFFADDDGNLVRSRNHFDSLGWSVVTTFQVMTPEGWNQVLIDGTRAVGWGGSVFLISLYIIGNYIMLSLFLAILLSNFGNADELKELWDKQQAATQLRQLASAGVVSPYEGDSDAEGDEDDEPLAHVRNDSKRNMDMEMQPGTAGNGVKRAGSRPKNGSMRRKPSAGPGAGQRPEPKDQGPLAACLGYFNRCAQGLSCCKSLSAQRAETKAAAAAEGKEAGLERVPSKQLNDFPILHHETNAFFSRKGIRNANANLHHRSLFCLGPDNAARIAVNKLINHWLFDDVVLVFILASCVFLALDEPSLDPKSQLASALHVADYVITAVFAAEALLKIFAVGFLMQPGSYMRDRWNVLDLFITLASVWSVLFSSTIGRWPRAFRALRALRPLRIISNFDNTRAVLGALVASFASIINIVLFGVLLFLIFAIIGVQFFAGRLSRCYIPPETLIDAASVSLNLTECGAAGGIWRNPTHMGNFDSVLSAYLFMFELSTQENWPKFMYAVVDATPFGLPPKTDYNQAAALYFIATILFVSFFYSNLFVGAIVEAYHHHHTMFSSGSGDLSDAHNKWVRIYRNILAHTPAFLLEKPPLVKPHTAAPPVLNRGASMPYDAAPDDQDDDDVFFGLHRESFCCNVCYSCSHPKSWAGRHCGSCAPSCTSCGDCCNAICYRPGRVLSRFRRAVYQAITMSWFDNAVTALIIFNTIIISINFWDEPSWYSTILQRCNDVCTWLYVLEMVLKCLAFGPRQYLRQRTNQWDLLVVIASVVDFLGNSVFLFSLDAPGMNPLFFRAVRVLRFFKLLYKFQGLRELILTLQFSLPGVYHIAFLMVVIFFVYSIAAMALFGSVKHGNYIDAYGNFETFPTAVLTLFRAMTGEDWNGLMRDCMVEAPFCDPGGDTSEQPGNCGSASQAVAFFTTFVLITQFLMVNIIIAVVLKNFEHEFEEGEATLDDSLPISVRDLTSFARVWRRFTRTETLPRRKLGELVRTLITLEDGHGGGAGGNGGAGGGNLSSDDAAAGMGFSPQGTTDAAAAMQNGGGGGAAHGRGPSNGSNGSSGNGNGNGTSVHNLFAKQPSRGKGQNGDALGSSLDEDEMRTAAAGDPALQAALTDEELADLVEELHIPENREARTVHYIDVLYQLSMRKFRMVVEMDQPLPSDHDMVVLCKAQALRKFPDLALHTYYRPTAAAAAAAAGRRGSQGGPAQGSPGLGPSSSTAAAAALAASPRQSLHTGLNGEVKAAGSPRLYDPDPSRPASAATGPAPGTPSGAGFGIAMRERSGSNASPRQGPGQGLDRKASSSPRVTGIAGGAGSTGELSGRARLAHVREAADEAASPMPASPPARRPLSVSRPGNGVGNGSPGRGPGLPPAAAAASGAALPAVEPETVPRAQLVARTESDDVLMQSLNDSL